MIQSERLKETETTRDDHLFGATYISRRAEGLTRANIQSIVTESSQRNQAESLSGFLIRAGRNFVQYLEGPQSCVFACLRRIESDSRHHDMKILAFCALDVRRFSDWSMRYFVGDIGGSYRLERALTQWPGSDFSLLEEIWRIGDAAQTGENDCSIVVHGPFDVLLRPNARHA